jgi:hypothetical protein
MPSTSGYIAVVLAALALLAPLAGAATVQSNSATASATVSDTEATAQEANATNYTRLYVEDRYRSVELRPGANETFEVTVENGESESVTISPRLVTPRVGDRPVKSGWVDISTPRTTLAPDEEVTVTVTVDVPEDAEMARYRGSVAFTDETISYPGRPPQPVHAAQFSVEVYREPTVFVVPLNEEYGRLQAGESYTHTVRVNNTGEEAVPVNPTVEVDERRYRPGQETARRDWFTVDAPSQVPAGESALVNVTVAVPEDATRGDYDAEVNLGLRDPARGDRGDYWQRIGMHFQVWKQPDGPFTKSFDVSESTTSVTVTLSAGDRGRTNADEEPASFDVTFVGPDGETHEPKRVEVTNGGYVDLADTRRYPRSEGAYAIRGDDRQVTYRLSDPAAGEWTARITPRNVVRFQYEIVRDEVTERSTDGDEGDDGSETDDGGTSEGSTTPTATDAADSTTTSTSTATVEGSEAGGTTADTETANGTEVTDETNGTNETENEDTENGNAST